MIEPWQKLKADKLLIRNARFVVVSRDKTKCDIYLEIVAWRDGNK